MNRHRIIAAVILGSLLQTANGQRHMPVRDSLMTQRVVELGPVVVTGSGHHQHLRSATTPVRVISQRDIRQTGVSNFSDALTRVMPQLSVAPNSMGSFLRMNGLGNKYVLILVNGKKLIGDISGNVDLNRINVGRIRRIEVLDGAASSLYGSDAIGGVVNIITEQPTDELIALTGDTRVSGKGQLKQTVNLDFYQQGFGSYTSWTYDAADSYRTNDYEYVSGEEGETQRTVAPLFPGYRSSVLSQRFTYSPTRRLSFHAEGQYGWRKTHRPNTNDEVKGGFDYEMRSESWRWNAGALYKLGRRNSIQFDLIGDNYGYGYQYDVPTKTYDVGEYAWKKNQAYYEAELKGIFALLPKGTTIVGADWRNDFLRAATGNVSGHAYTWAGYVQHEQTLIGDLKMTAGLRYNYHKTFGSDLTPKVALMYAPGPFNFRAAYSRGYRTPGLDELYYHYCTWSRGVSTITLGNQQLRPEKSDYFSLGAEYNGQRFSLGVTGYINRVADMIIKENVDVDDRNIAQLRQEFPEITDEQALKLDHYQHYINSDRGRVYGVQVNGSVTLFSDLRLSASYAYTYARTQTADEAWQLLERSIKNTATVSADYSHRWRGYGLGVNLNGRLQSRTYYSDKYDDAPGFGIWNLNTTHHFSPCRWLELEPSIGIDNLFNRVDRRIDSARRRFALYSPGRMLVVGLRFKLK
ncbi:MAG: TonB-dependent receptor [Prevotella sp.]|nr:TonB-dependent receptor [Prevotella sp.]